MAPPNYFRFVRKDFIPPPEYTNFTWNLDRGQTYTGTSGVEVQWPLWISDHEVITSSSGTTYMEVGDTGGLFYNDESSAPDVFTRTNAAFLGDDLCQGLASGTPDASTPFHTSSIYQSASIEFAFDGTDTDDEGIVYPNTPIAQILSEHHSNFAKIYVGTSATRYSGTNGTTVNDDEYDYLSIEFHTWGHGTVGSLQRNRVWIRRHNSMNITVLEHNGTTPDLVGSYGLGGTNGNFFGDGNWNGQFSDYEFHIDISPAYTSDSVSHFQGYAPTDGKTMLVRDYEIKARLKTSSTAWEDITSTDAGREYAYHKETLGIAVQDGWRDFRTAWGSNTIWVMNAAIKVEMHVTDNNHPSTSGQATKFIDLDYIRYKLEDA